MNKPLDASEELYACGSLTAPRLVCFIRDFFRRRGKRDLAEAIHLAFPTVGDFVDYSERNVDFLAEWWHVFWSMYTGRTISSVAANPATIKTVDVQEDFVELMCNVVRNNQQRGRLPLGNGEFSLWKIGSERERLGSEQSLLEGAREQGGSKDLALADILNVSSLDSTPSALQQDVCENFNIDS